MSSIPFIDASNCCTLQVSQVPKLHMVHFIFNCQSIGFLFYYHFVKPCSFLQLAILPLFVPLTVLFSKQEVRLIGGMCFLNISILYSKVISFELVDHCTSAKSCLKKINFSKFEIDSTLNRVICFFKKNLVNDTLPISGKMLISTVLKCDSDCNQVFLFFEFTFQINPFKHSIFFNDFGLTFSKKLNFR